MFLATLKLAIINLYANKKQSILTMLGVIIGIASVITIVALGSGAQSLITNTITEFGTNIMAVVPGNNEEGGGPPAIARGIIITTLKKKDVEQIAKIEGVQAVLPIVLGNTVATYKNVSENIPYFGVGNQFPIVHDFEIDEGRFFTDREVEGIARVVVLGTEVKKTFFGDESPIGKNIKIDQKSFKIIGVLEEVGTVFFVNQDNQVYVPYTTAQKQMLGIDYLHVLRLRAKTSEDIPHIEEAATAILRKNHNIHDPKNDDFEFRTQEQALDVLGGVTQGLKMFLATIAGISLVVGGIGIMNMMLVIVTRRTREIGLRKAVGAKRKHIITQFLIESSVITLVGGIIGIIIGTTFAFIVAVVVQSLEYDWDFIVSIESILLSCGLALTIGVVFGLYPAIKAARLNPIDALRYE